MKIQCEYCGAYFDDTNAKCPNCGAPNAGVVRTTSNQPLTIEELAQWYKDRGLPPYETTRFFIGENYTKPRAFGIYKDEETGNFVVYKNKDNGQRAVRYEGTDEAYAVNELFQRLKQEIIEQKNRKLAKQRGQSPTQVNYGNASRNTYAPKKKRRSLGCLSIVGIVIVAIIGFFGIASVVYKIIDFPEEGYYAYDDSVMYYMEWANYDDYGYTVYDPETDSWSAFLSKDQIADVMKKNKTAQEYYLGYDWDESYGCNDFRKTDEYAQLAGLTDVRTGYFNYDDTVYYHDADDRYSGWYYYDSSISDWQIVGSENVPDDLTQYYRADDFYYTPDWDSDTQISDFTDTSYYSSNHTYDSSSDEDSSWWDNDDDDSSYDWDWGDSDWDSGGSSWDSDW